jgi:RHS repeat-associated protein
LTLANSYAYATWGAPTTTTHNGIADLGFRFTYVGQHGVQSEAPYGLDLFYMQARHYAPALGRFLQPDPVAAEANAWAYVENSPVSKIDPEGTAFFFAIPLVWVVGATAVSVFSVWVAVDTVPRFQRLIIGRSSVIPLGDQVAQGIINLAKSARDKLRNLRAAERKVIEKIKAEPNSPARNHWERNLQGIRVRINNLLRRNSYLQ